MRIGAGDAGWDFFVSHTDDDTAWAEWIAWQLEDAGYRVLVPAWDRIAGSNVAATIQEGVRHAKRTIAVLTPSYLESGPVQQEWHAAQISDHDGLNRKLLPVKVAACTPSGLLASRVAVELVGVAQQAARERLLNAVRAAEVGRAKPSREPMFPGLETQRVKPDSAPAFPGPLPAQPLPSIQSQSSRQRLPATAGKPPSAQYALGIRSVAKVVKEPTRAIDGSGQESFRALFLGVSNYEDDRLPSRPSLPGELGAAAEALERLGYQVEVHDRTRTGASAIKAAIQEFLRNAQDGETSLLFLSGNAVHLDGQDHLVPTDAVVGYQPFSEMCVPIDLHKTITRSASSHVLVFVDAVSAYSPETASLVTADGWATGSYTPVADKDIAYLLARTAAPVGHGGLARSLIHVLSRGEVAANLADLETALRDQLEAAPHGERGHGGAEQAEGPVAEFHTVDLCDPTGVRPVPGASSAAGTRIPDHAWYRAASRHVGWQSVADGPGVDRLRAASLDLVHQLALDRDRMVGRMSTDPWTVPGLALRMTERVGFLLTKLSADGDLLSPAEIALLVVAPFLHEAYWTRLAATAAAVRPTDLEFRVETGERAEFRDFARQFPRLLRRAERIRHAASSVPPARGSSPAADPAGDTRSCDAIGWWLLHRWVAMRTSSYSPATALSGLLSTIDAEPLVAEVFHEHRIMEVLRAFRSEPGFLGRNDRISYLRDPVTVATASPR